MSLPRWVVQKSLKTPLRNIKMAPNHTYFIIISVLSWADVPNWPQLTNQLNSGNNLDNDQTSRSDTKSDNLIGKYPMFNHI